VELLGNGEVNQLISRSGQHYSEAWFIDKAGEMVVCAYKESGCGYHSVARFTDRCRDEGEECVQVMLCME
jgi:hypothetical protein